LQQRSQLSSYCSQFQKYCNESEDLYLDLMGCPHQFFYKFNQSIKKPFFPETLQIHLPLARMTKFAILIQRNLSINYFSTIATFPCGCHYSKVNISNLSWRMKSLRMTTGHTLAMIHCKCWVFIIIIMPPPCWGSPMVWCHRACARWVWVNFLCDCDI